MKSTVSALLLSLLVCTPAFADWDAEAEAREQAVRDAELRREAEQQRKAQQMKAGAQTQFDAGVMAEKRKTLGAAAKGKSDAEVNALYDAKSRRDSQQATKTGVEIQAKTRTALGSGDGARALKDMTGKSLADMENMSDAELEALGAEMERKYGN